MIQLSSDPNFHYEAIRTLGLVSYMGGDVAEQLNVLSHCKPGDGESWYHEWFTLAQKVLSTIDESRISSYHPATLRNIYFRVSHYIFVSDFFIHANVKDPRLNQNFKLWREYFDKATAVLPIPPINTRVQSPHGFDMPVIIFRAAGASASDPRPTILIGGGFDSNMEECLHTYGFAALERGYNVILYEGPGQPSLLQEQQKGFIHDWEKAVNPIVDYIFEQSKNDLAFIDTSKLALLGMSLGGYLAVRAAAHEPRLAAVIIHDGVMDMMPPVMAAFPDCKDAWAKRDEAAFDAAFDNTTAASSTSRRWLHDQTKYSFQASGFHAVQEVAKMNCHGGWLSQVKMPAFIGDAKSDIFFLGQPQQVAAGIGAHATVFEFTEEQSADAHCCSGANFYMNNVWLEWFARVIGESK